MADPITRQEIYLAYIAGEWNGELPTPVTREEQYLYNIAVNGTGSTVEVTQIKETGEKIATITVDGEATDIYASAGGGAVDTVNGMTGDVVLTASDVGALPDDTNIPTKTSDLTNDSNFVSDADYVHTDNNYTTAEKTAVGTISGKQDKTLTISVKIGTETETTVEGVIGEVAAIIPATAAVSNKLSTAADTAGKDITATANSEDIALTDAADARVHDLRIYGKTENGHSVGENGLTVTACGKNMFNINGNVNMRHQPYKDGTDWYSNGWTQDSVSRNTVSGNTLNAYYNVSADWGNGQLIDVEEGKTYTISYIVTSFGTGSTNACVRADIEPSGAQSSMNDFMLGRKYTSTLNQKDSFTVTIPTGITQILVAFYANNGRNALFTDIQVEEGASATEYEPYHSNAIEITTALPLRRKMLTVNLGDLDWGYDQYAHTDNDGRFARFYSLTALSDVFDPIPRKGLPSDDAYMIATSSCSSRYTISGSAGGHEPIVDKTLILSKRGIVYAVDNSYTDPAEFKAAVTGITLTYPSYCDEIDLADGVAITRLDTNGDALATPVITPLTTAEKAAFAEFRTFDDNTNVTATDDPFMSMVYVKNTDNGKALADVDNRIEETFTATEKAKLAGIATGATANTVIDTTCTLTVAGWTGAAAPYTQTVNVTGILATDRPILDLSVSSTVATGIDEIDDWALISKAETGAGTITFSCYEDIPTTELAVNVKVVR